MLFVKHLPHSLKTFSSDSKVLNLYLLQDKVVKNMKEWTDLFNQFNYKTLQRNKWMNQKGCLYLLCLSFTISSKELFLYISSGLVIASSPNSLLQVISIFITYRSNYPLMMQLVFVRCNRSLPNTSLLLYHKTSQSYKAH